MAAAKNSSQQQARTQTTSCTRFGQRHVRTLIMSLCLRACQTILFCLSKCARVAQAVGDCMVAEGFSPTLASWASLDHLGSHWVPRSVLGCKMRCGPQTAVAVATISQVIFYRGSQLGARSQAPEGRVAKNAIMSPSYSQYLPMASSRRMFPPPRMPRTATRTARGCNSPNLVRTGLWEQRLRHYLVCSG